MKTRNIFSYKGVETPIFFAAGWIIILMTTFIEGSTIGYIILKKCLVDTSWTINTLSLIEVVLAGAVCIWLGILLIYTSKGEDRQC